MKRNSLRLRNKLIALFWALLLAAISSCSSTKSEQGGERAGDAATPLASPDKSISVQFRLSDDKRAFYSISRNDSVVLQDSKLGVEMEDADFTQGLVLESVSGVEQVRDSYEMLNAKRRYNTYTANKQTFHLRNEAGQKVDIIFQVSDDGVAFRYYFPGESTDKKKISKEITSFKLPEGAKAWLQPMSDAKTGWEKTNPSYEEHYQKDIAVGTPSPIKAGWVFPALFRSGSTWLLVTESASYGDYCGSRLHAESPGGEYSIDFPQEEEKYPGEVLNPESALPWFTPWRIVAVGSLKTIAESTLGTDLAKPAVTMDQSFIKPGKASWSWVILKDDSTVYNVQKRFIDYAADMNWSYCLIDADWDRKIGYEKIKELADYAKTKNVGLVLWYNSAGPWNTAPYTPRDKMLTREVRQQEFARLQQMGIKGVKVDFFGGDGQSVMQYYIDILNDAAAHKLLVNFHGCTLPRGWQRTYPNLMTMESIKGMEFITFEQRNADEAATHNTMLPFTRNAFDPMDFTPVNLSGVPNINRRTTVGHELALSVLFLSGIQHYADTPQGMQTVPPYVKDFMRQVPVVWDDSRFVDGFPGKLAVIARKAGDRWYVAGINGENTEKKVQLDLSFISQTKGQYITDGKEKASFQNNTVDLSASRTQEVTLKPNGGFVMVF
ncbi:glycoside hydrolase family 97 protein [Pontibacter beigongshangensis]|uniref:glycoside hydrolase family 97 protein n=1 Tax=Pontibacter beigongshangensis TaxID=2574733 RepID=UPI001650AA8F|nr:glycoside hydrolase family 97 protein [Pontibacter beigongshangensis]